MSKRMMILGASALQVPAIEKAKSLGYEVIAVDYDENAVGFSLADIKLVVSTLDQEEVYRQALIYHPDVVITSTSDGPVRTAAYVNEKLGKQPDLSYKDSLCATIKSYMRDRLKENGIPIPQYYATDSFEAFKLAVGKLEGACIVKPADNAGSRGVVLIDGQTPGTDEKLEEIYEYSKSNSKNGIVMVEEYMSGREVSVEAMTVKGKTEIITVTDKYITPPPYFVELAHSEPSSLDEETLEQVKETAKKAVAAIRLMNGPSHTEVMVTKSGPKIVELAARLGGDFITSKLVPLSTGVDMVGSSVLLAAGGQPDLTEKWNRGAAIRFIQGTKGRIESIKIKEEAYRIKGVEEVVIYKKEGDQVNTTQSSNDRLGHVIASGETAQEAMKAAEGALQYIEIKIKKKRIYVCHTYYHVYIACLKELNLPIEERKQADLVLSTMSNDFGDLQVRAQACGLFENVYMFEEKEDIRFPEVMRYHTDRGNLILNMLARMKYTKLLGKMQQDYVPVDFKEYEDIYVFCDSDPIGYYLSYKKIPYHAIEDGLDCISTYDTARYDNRGHFRLKAFLSSLNLIFIQNGWGKYCLDMEVNDLSVLPYPCPKYVERPRKQLVERLDHRGKDILVHLFISDMDEINRKLNAGGSKNKILLLTEPLCELPVREKIFRDCINQFGKIDGEDSIVLIKPHPRDVLDYSKIFPEHIILDGKFPMEVLNYIPGLKFRRVISVFTVVHAIEFAEEIIYLGEDFMDNYEAPQLHRQNETIALQP